MYGIQHIAMAKKGTGNLTATNVVIIGTRNNEELNINDVSQDDVRGRPLIIKRRFETPVIEDRQPSLLKLQNVLSVYGADRGCDAEILCEPASSGVDGGCFQFISNNYIGVKGSYEVTPDKRILGIKLGVSLEKNAAKTLVDAADSATPLTLGISNKGIDTTKERVPWPYPYHPTLGVSNLVDYSFLLEEEGSEEKLYGRWIQQFIKATMTFTFDDQTIANFISDMAEAEGMSLYFRQDTASATFEKFIFNANALRKKTEIKISNKERFAKLTYTGMFPRTNMSYSFTSQNGGGTSADGTEGGTVTIAA